MLSVGALERVDPPAAVVVGDRHAVDFSGHIAQQPVFRRYFLCGFAPTNYLWISACACGNRTSTIVTQGRAKHVGCWWSLLIALRSVSTLILIRDCQIYVVKPVSGELPVSPEPGECPLLAEGLLAPILPPVNIRFGTQNAGAPLAPGMSSVMKGRMLMRTPSLMSGSQPIGCSSIGFQRTKISKGCSPPAMASRRFRNSNAAAKRSSAPPSPRFTPSCWRLIQSPR